MGQQEIEDELAELISELRAVVARRRRAWTEDHGEGRDTRRRYCAIASSAASTVMLHGLIEAVEVEHGRRPSFVELLRLISDPHGLTESISADAAAIYGVSKMTREQRADMVIELLRTVANIPAARE